MENDLRSSMIFDNHLNNHPSSTQQEPPRNFHRTPNQIVDDEMSLLSEEFNNIFKDIFKEIEYGHFLIPYSNPNGLFIAYLASFS